MKAVLLCTGILLLRAPGLLWSEEPIKVTVCQIQKDPPAFDHKLVEVEAFVSQGFEDFTLFDPSCYIYPEIWLEYGGKVNSGTIYFGPGTDSRTRPEDLVVQNIPIPLVDDATFYKFDERIHIKGPRGHGPVTHATLVGRYFAGRKEKYPNRTSAWSGFGHFGCCTLLAIQQILDVTIDDRQGTDSFEVPLPFIAGFKSDPRYYYSLLPGDMGSFELEMQKNAETDLRTWSFSDPKRVATELIEKDLDGAHADFTQLKESHVRAGLTSFTMSLPMFNLKYEVLVARPYWLSFYAKDPNRVAWVALSATAERLNKTKTLLRPHP